MNCRLERKRENMAKRETATTNGQNSDTIIKKNSVIAWDLERYVRFVVARVQRAQIYIVHIRRVLFRYTAVTHQELSRVYREDAR